MEQAVVKGWVLKRTRRNGTQHAYQRLFRKLITNYLIEVEVAQMFEIEETQRETRECNGSQNYERAREWDVPFAVLLSVRVNPLIRLMS